MKRFIISALFCVNSCLASSEEGEVLINSLSPWVQSGIKRDHLKSALLEIESERRPLIIAASKPFLTTSMDGFDVSSIVSGFYDAPTEAIKPISIEAIKIISSTPATPQYIHYLLGCLSSIPFALFDKGLEIIYKRLSPSFDLPQKSHIVSIVAEELEKQNNPIYFKAVEEICSFLGSSFKQEGAFSLLNYLIEIKESALPGFVTILKKTLHKGQTNGEVIPIVDTLSHLNETNQTHLSSFIEHISPFELTHKARTQSVMLLAGRAIESLTPLHKAMMLLLSPTAHSNDSLFLFFKETQDIPLKLLGFLAQAFLKLPISSFSLEERLFLLKSFSKLLEETIHPTIDMACALSPLSKDVSSLEILTNHTKSLPLKDFVPLTTLILMSSAIQRRSCFIFKEAWLSRPFFASVSRGYLSFNSNKWPLSSS